ncbi:MAG TPA: ADOP family duplicated permease [Acidobacteriota bacterium]|nr:ADOP family duplicated permease [Acidobacteriota bacterium]
MKDWKLAWRGLWRQKSYTLTALLALALGIGGVTAVFSVVNGVLLRSLPYPQPERVLFIRQNMPPIGSGLLFSPTVFDQLEDSAEEVADLALVDRLTFNVLGGEQAERVTGAQVSPGYFQIFGIQPLRGRLPEERLGTSRQDRPAPGLDSPPASPQDRDSRSVSSGAAREQPPQEGNQAQLQDPGAQGQPEAGVCVIGYEFWQSRMGGREDVLGQVLTVDVTVPFGPRRPIPRQLEIIGVLGPDFRPPLGGRLDILTSFHPTQGGAAGFPYLFTFAKLRPGLPLEAAYSRLEALYAALPFDDNEQIEQRTLRSTPLPELGTNRVRSGLLMLWAASALVLLIACANVAHLQLARAARRRGEIALRGALGAGRLRLLRTLLSESLLLALLGGTAGIALAFGALQALRSYGPSSLPRLEFVSLDLQVLAFALLVSVVTCLLFGIIPAWRGSGTHPRRLLQEEGRGGALGGRRLGLRALLTGGEMALAFVLLVTASMVLQSLGRLQAVDPGFSSESVLTMQIQMPLDRYREGSQRRQIVDRLVQRYQALPGVKQAGATFTLPFSTVQNAVVYQIVGRSEERLRAGHYDISRDYLAALDVPVLRGRAFRDTDYRSGDQRPRTALINQALAEQQWPDGDPLGQRLLLQGEEDPVEIVGVVGNVLRRGLGREAEPILYLPFLPSGNVSFVLRTDANPAALTPQVRHATSEVDPTLALFAIRPLKDIVDGSLSGERFNTLLMSCFAAVALLLAVTGIYGVISYTVAGRTREIAVRMALGARPADVLRLVLTQGGLPLLVGTLAGAAAAFMAGGTLQSQFFGVQPADPLLYLLAAALLNAAALLATYLPARRAAAISPQTALRS